MSCMYNTMPMSKILNKLPLSDIYSICRNTFHLLIDLIQNSEQSEKLRYSASIIDQSKIMKKENA